MMVNIVKCYQENIVFTKINKTFFQDFFDVLDSDMDSINSALDQIEERANTILEAIQALTRSMKEDRCGTNDITDGMQSTTIEENENKDEIK